MLWAFFYTFCHFKKPLPCSYICRYLRPEPLPPPVSWWQIALSCDLDVATRIFQPQTPDLRRLGAPNQVEFLSASCKFRFRKVYQFHCLMLIGSLAIYWLMLTGTNLPVNLCTYHLYWSVLTCTVQFILTVVPTTGYGVVRFKILKNLLSLSFFISGYFVFTN